jgi:hypothetical protein
MFSARLISPIDLHAAVEGGAAGRGSIELIASRITPARAFWRCKVGAD